MGCSDECIEIGPSGRLICLRFDDVVFGIETCEEVASGAANGEGEGSERYGFWRSSYFRTVLPC